MSAPIAVRYIALTASLRAAVSGHVVSSGHSQVEMVLERRSDRSRDPTDFHPVGTPVRIPGARLDEFVAALRHVTERASNAALFVPLA